MSDPAFARIPLTLEQVAISDMNQMLAAAELYDKRIQSGNATDAEKGQAIIATLKALWSKSFQPASVEVMTARFNALNAREVKPKVLFEKHEAIVSALWSDEAKRAAFIDLAARNRIRITVVDGKLFFELETRMTGQPSTFAPMRKDYTFHEDGTITLN